VNRPDSTALPPREYRINIPERRNLTPVAGWAVVTVLCLVFGYLAATAGIAWVAAAALGLGLCLAILQRPLYGVMAIVLLSGVVPRSILFERSLPLLGGGVKVTDALLALTIGSWLLARYTGPRPPRLPSTLTPWLRSRLGFPSKSTTWLLLLFLAVSVTSLVTARQMGTPFKISLLELRPLLMYLTIFVVVADLKKSTDYGKMFAFLLAGAVVAAVEVFVRYRLGDVGLATFSGDASRVPTDVFLLPTVGLVCALALLTSPRRALGQLALVLAAAVCGAALFFTFSRGAWLAVAAAVVFIILIAPRRRRPRILLAVVGLLAVGLVLVTAVNSTSAIRSTAPLASAFDRLTSVASSSTDPSAQHRLAEWQRALEVSADHPLTGIGLGSTISFSSPLYSAESGRTGDTFTTYYIHNSYVWLLLKLGIPGLLLLVALVATCFAKGLRSYLAADDPRTKSRLLALTGAMVALLAVSFTGPHLTTDAATPVLAVVIGMIEASPFFLALPESLSRRSTSTHRPRRAPRTLRLLLFDWTAGGHHPIYLRKAAQALSDKVDVIVAAPDQYLPGLTQLALETRSLGPARPGLDPDRSAADQHRELALAEIAHIRETVAETRPDHLIHLYADPIIRRLVEVPALPCPTTLCLFFPRAHYPRAFDSHMTAQEMLHARYLEHLVRRWRRRPDAHALFSLDTEAVRLWSQRRGAAAYWFPEPPIDPLPPDFGQMKRSGYVLYGSLARRKGLHLLADAVASRRTPVRIVLAGEVETGFESEVERHVLRMERAGAQIELHLGRQDEQEGLRLLAQAQYALMPYPRHYGASRVLLEAASVGTPVIVNDFGLIAHLVKRHSLGVAVDCTDPQRFRDTLLGQLADPTTPARYGEALSAFTLAYSASSFQRAILAPFSEERPS
jgi:O-antigen ligase/glycosyltransferase involved in cell wall biosynthesis